MLNRLFTTIVANVGNNIQDTSTSMATIIKTYANDTYFDILKRTNFKEIDYDYSFSTVAATQDYAMPSNFGKELSVYDATNKIPLDHIDYQLLIEQFVDSISSQGTVERYTIFSSPVRKQPTSASTLSITSSSALDTTQTIRIKGTDSNGVELDESVTVTGTSAAVSTNTYLKVRSITKSATTTGRITITSNAAAVTVAIMSPADLDYRVKIMRLHEVPSSVLTINVPYIILPYPLSNDYDTPVLDCSDVLELGTTAKAWRYKRQFSKAMDFQNLYEQGIQTLIWDKENQPNQPHFFNPKPYSRNDV